MKRFLAAMMVVLAGNATGQQMGQPPKRWLWITPSQISQLPMIGDGWDDGSIRGVWRYAQESQYPTTSPNISFGEDAVDVYVLAKALVWLRLKQESPLPEPIEHYRAEVEAACLAARETENGGDTLALGRNLLGYVLAASIIDWSSQLQEPVQRLALCGAP